MEVTSYIFDPIISNKNDIKYEFCEYQTKRYALKSFFEIIEQSEE